jgi:hypothetical protein
MSSEFELILLALGGLLLGALIKGPSMQNGSKWFLSWIPNNLIPVAVFLAGAAAGEFVMNSLGAMQAGLSAVGTSTAAAELLQLIGVSGGISKVVGNGGAK